MVIAVLCTCAKAMPRLKMTPHQHCGCIRPATSITEMRPFTPHPAEAGLLDCPPSFGASCRLSQCLNALRPFVSAVLRGRDKGSSRLYGGGGPYASWILACGRSACPRLTCWTTAVPRGKCEATIIWRMRQTPSGDGCRLDLYPSAGIFCHPARVTTPGTPPSVLRLGPFARTS